MAVAGIQRVADVPELLLAQGTGEVNAAAHVPVAVDVLRPGGAHAGRRVVSIGGSDGVMRNVGIQRDGEVLVDAVLTGRIARIEPPVGLRLQVGVTLADVQRIAGGGDVDELSDAGCRQAVLGVDHERLAIFVEAGVVLPVYPPVVVIAVYGGVEHVAVVAHVLATEIPVERQVHILIALALFRLVVTDGATDRVHVYAFALFRRVRGVECQRQRVGGHG